MAGNDDALMEQLKGLLNYHYGYATFRAGQLEAIQATLGQRDSLVVLKTGGGKSLCFQLPALAKDGFTVVICPLIALARDQVQRCTELDLDAELWNCEVSEDKRASIVRDIVSDSPSLKLLYATPESLRTPKLREALQEAAKQGTLVSFAIDEAHCVSEWGCDFRPAYLELASLRNDFSKIPIAAFTASCTKDVQKSISSVLNMKDPVIITSSFNRQNIEYQVAYRGLIDHGSEQGAVQHLVEFITRRKGQCGIIYARLRKTCDWLASVLSSHDLDVSCYHAGKDAAQRRKVQSEWSEGSVDVVVATIAFGMGIDKADVRWVVHWNAPSSVEGFYQESGRAGRDGQPSVSVVYASYEDLEANLKLEKGTRRGAVQEMAGLLMQPGCRRRKLLKYFGEVREACDASQGEQLCDFCTCPATVRRQLRQLEDSQQVKAEQMVQQGAAAGASRQQYDTQQVEDRTSCYQRSTGRPRGTGWGSAVALKECNSTQQPTAQPDRANGLIPALKLRRKAHGPTADATAAVVPQQQQHECAAESGLPCIVAAEGSIQCEKVSAAQILHSLQPAQAHPVACRAGQILVSRTQGAARPGAGLAVRRPFVPPKKSQL